MEAFSVLLAPCVGNTPVTGGIPSQRGSEAHLWCDDIFDNDVRLNKVFIKNNRMAGDLRRHDAHCEFTIMLIQHNIFQYDVVE